MKTLLALFCLLLPLHTLMAQSAPTPNTSTGVFHALRLTPGQDLRQTLLQYAQQHRLQAAAIVSCVGSLTTANIRYANQEQGTMLTGHFEIVSLVGTLALDGSHLHLSVSDSTGRTLGGHLLDGARIYTTAEIVLVKLPALHFTRQPDPTFGYRELFITPRKRE